MVDEREVDERAVTTLLPVALIKKLLAVMADVGYIKKDKKNEFHRYNYASEQAIKEALHPVLVKHGVLFLPVGCDILSDIETVNSKGNKERLMTVRYAYRFVDGETGDFIDGYSIGTGVDASDKSAYKAITGCIKYILTGTFLIPTGDDPEQDDKNRTGSREQQEAVRDRKLGRTPEPPDAPPPSLEYADAPPSAPPQKGPQAVATSKNFKALEAFKTMKSAIGEPLYYGVLRAHGFEKSNQITDDKKAREVYKAMGEVKKAVDAAANGELVANMPEAVFNTLPETSIAAILKEFRGKLAVACGGQDIAREEYEDARKASSTQWNFCNALAQKLEFYVKQGVSA